MTTIWTRAVSRLGMLAGAVLALSLPARGAECSRITHAGQGYSVCTVSAAEEPRLGLWIDDARGRKLGGFSSLRSALPDGQSLVFAMNAGMFHRDYEPVGLYKSGDDLRGRLVTGGGGGNFGLLPNGVFCAGGASPFRVYETGAFAAAQPQCRLATQSGPMLVIEGELHPRFLVDSDSRYIRNGVGVSAEGDTAWFAISDRPVTFHEFGRFYRDGLGARNALYFDGSISRLHAPSLNRSDFGWPMGPIIGLVDGG